MKMSSRCHTAALLSTVTSNYHTTFVLGQGMQFPGKMMQTKHVLYCQLALIVALIGPTAQANNPNAIPKYKPAKQLEGEIISAGSDTLANLMTLWSVEFQRLHPKVRFSIQTAGSATAPMALISERSNIGPMSRKMKTKEIAAFEKKFGYPPVGIPVAMDLLAVFVHKDNPLAGLTIQDVDAVFSDTRKCGATINLTKWSQLGLHGKLASHPIHTYGRNPLSGTYSYFRKVALCGGDYRADLQELAGSASVVRSIAEDIGGIGYSGIGYLDSRIRALPLASEFNRPFVAPNPKNATDGSYPLARFLYIYINQIPHKNPEPIVMSFIRFILSREGQRVVLEDGYVPLSTKSIRNTLRSIYKESRNARHTLY